MPVTAESSSSVTVTVSAVLNTKGYTLPSPPGSSISVADSSAWSGSCAAETVTV